MAPIIQAQANEDPSSPNCVRLRWNSFASSGNTENTAWRSAYDLIDRVDVPQEKRYYLLYRHRGPT